MKTYLSIAIIIVLAAVGVWTWNSRLATTSDVQACTQEAKICPDGSSVGRTGPNCEFTACPSASTTTGSTDSNSPSIVAYSSGIHGTVSLGPTCPVQRTPPDPACANKPYATTIVVRRSGSSATFSTTESLSSGAFKISLPPGNYTLTAGGDKTLPRCGTVEVTVAAQGYVTANISCDTGIR